MAEIRFEEASLQYEGNPRPTIDRLDLDIVDGEFIAVVGPSGSGKSTTLRMVAGLEQLTGGEIYIGGRAASTLAPSKRDVAMVFQTYALYPHMTVAENMAFALKMQKVSASVRKERVAEAARLLDLEPYLDRLPKALSGGQRQRVAMGRAIVRAPSVFLMDEPLSNLDAKLRVSTRSEISQLQRRLGTTTMYVTHDQTEAMTMADRIAVLEGGTMQQVGAPEELYRRPVNAFVAQFIGSPSMNLIDGQLAGSSIRAGGMILPTPTLVSEPSSEKILVGIRPEDFRVGTPEDSAIAIRATFVENFGADKYVHGTVDNGAEIGTLLVRVSNKIDVAVGDRFGVSVEADTLHVFDGETKERIVP